MTTLRAWRAITAGTLISRGCILLDSHHLTGLRATADPWERASGSQASAIIETAGSNPCNGNAFSPASLARRIRTSQRARRQCWSPPVTLLMVPDGRCQRAGPAAAGTGVLPLSVDDLGARVTCGSRALVTADKGNGPPQKGRGSSQAWVRDRSSTGWPLHPGARGGRRDGYRGHRRLHRYRASARSGHWATALSQDGRKVLDRALAGDEDRLRETYQHLQELRGGCWWWSISPPPSGPWPWRWPSTWAAPWATRPDCP